MDYFHYISPFLEYNTKGKVCAGAQLIKTLESAIRRKENRDTAAFSGT
jgi:hypothetical protein